MPEFETVSISEAKRQTATGRHGRIMSEYAPFLQALPPGHAGRLTAGERENPLTIRRLLVATAKALGTPLTIKRNGADIYFWKEDGGGEGERRKRRYTRRTKRQEETAEQYFQQTGELQQGIPVEESPELGQTPV